MRKKLTMLTAVLACTALVACGSGDKGIKLGATHKVGDDATYSIQGADQTSNGKALKVPDAYLKDRGYIAIHSDAGGAPGPVIGVSDMLPAGEAKNVRIKLTKPLAATAAVWPMVHLEDNGNTTYDFPNGDAPAKVNDKVVVVKVNVTVR